MLRAYSPNSSRVMSMTLRAFTLTERAGLDTPICKRDNSQTSSLRDRNMVNARAISDDDVSMYPSVPGPVTWN